MKKGTKIFLSIFLIIAIILGCLIWWWCGFFYSTSSYFYNQVSQNEYNPLPTIESLPEHKSVKYKFFKDYETMDGIGHCGIYIGDGNFIHASNPSDGVKITTLLSGYYAQRYVGARRVI